VLTATCGQDADAVRVRIALTAKWPSSLVPTAESGSLQRSTLCAEVRNKLFGGGGGRGGLEWGNRKIDTINIM